MVALKSRYFSDSEKLITFVNENPVRVKGITNSVDFKIDGLLTLFYEEID